MVAAGGRGASTNVQSVASHRGDDLVHQRDQPPGAGIGAGWPARPSIRRGRTNDRVGELSKAAAGSGDVVELINTIADRQSARRVNATHRRQPAPAKPVAASRCVASEVKALAEQTAKATGEIGQQITASRRRTQESVNASRKSAAH